MRGMILAAGRGGRMGHLTEQLPKPLLKVGNFFLIEYSIKNLVKVGVKEIVINVCYRGDQIKGALGDGTRYGAAIVYSEEKEALETGGGIVKALPILGNEPFIVLSADVIAEYALENLAAKLTRLAHVVLVKNPSFHLEGDFCLEENQVCYGAGQTFTYSNIGIYRPSFFEGAPAGKFRLGHLLKLRVMEEEVTGEYFEGGWWNIGTEKELASVNPNSFTGV